MGASHFSLLVQRKVGKRNTPRRSARRTRRVRIHDGNFRTGHPALAENGAHPCAPPCGFYPPGLPDLRGPGSKSKRVRDLLLLLLFGVPMRHGEWAGYNPKGAVMDDGVSVWHMDVPYGNSRTARGPGARSAEGVPPGVCFFDSFFAQAKKECLRGERRHV